MPSYVYSVRDIYSEKLSSTIGRAPSGVGTTNDGDIRFVFASSLSVDEKAGLDDYLGNRGMVPSTKTILFHATSKLADLEIPVTEDQNWQILSGVVANPAFFVPELARVLGRVVGSTQTSGEGAQLRLVENNGSSDVVIASCSLADSSGEWIITKFVTSAVPRAGDMIYRLEGRLNGATSAAVRFCSLSLLEIL